MGRKLSGPLSCQKIWGQQPWETVSFLLTPRENLAHRATRESAGRKFASGPSQKASLDRAVHDWHFVRDPTSQTAPLWTDPLPERSFSEGSSKPSYGSRSALGFAPRPRSPLRQGPPFQDLSCWCSSLEREKLKHPISCRSIGKIFVNVAHWEKRHPEPLATATFPKGCCPHSRVALPVGRRSSWRNFWRPHSVNGPR